MPWPSTLPAPVVSGYQIQPADQTIRTEMEVGAPRQRRRTMADDDRLSVVWLFTDAEMVLFRDWFRDASGAAGGAAWFTGMDIATGDGGVIDSLECRFTGPWQANLLPGLSWQVQGKLETR